MKLGITFVLLFALLALTTSSCKDRTETPDVVPEETAKTIWTGAKMNFIKADAADWTLEANQDRITDNVWITRANNKGVFNIAKEQVYNGQDADGNSPLDTEWALGSTSNIDGLTFSKWAKVMDGEPPFYVDSPMVVHLISDDIYIDIKFTSWAVGDFNGKGGFSYERSTN